MADNALPELPYERIAMAGGEMPNGLEYPDQILFMELSLLYGRYRLNLIDRETATAEKKEIIKTYEAHKIVDDCGKEWVDQIKRTELARAMYRKERTLENADRVIECVEGKRFYG